MKLEEAIEIFENEIEAAEDEIDLAYRDVYIVAVKQLWKGIAKEPIKVTVGGMDMYFCPVCDEHLEEGQHHCRCDQKLKWEKR